MGGGGGGGGKGGSAPEVPMPAAPEPIPIREREAEVETQASRASEKTRIKNLRGTSGTVLTSPLGGEGASAGANVGSSSVLGKV